jgi:hypothetical protein
MQSHAYIFFEICDQYHIYDYVPNLTNRTFYDYVDLLYEPHYGKIKYKPPTVRNIMRNRSKGYIGQIVDGKKLAVIANGIYNLQYSSDFSECTVDNLMLITLEEKNVFGDNKYALVCSEGVGWEQDTYGCLEVPTNIGQMGLWNGRVFISVDTVKECLTEQTEDIADYIRVFGDRLDNNCSLWQSKMSDPSVMIEA